ncbi:hypothetical protein DES53_101905 [Roseimicrobium gellanilyticum]|uniref:Uncharacterized protein n=1 Tax=Roseimicrobium gellanilyticum TaxID=748857 RepID=A0A366HX92_9BACT|nr:hypothetical protein [Roseimicrobium gellanilyticum]RBP48105.1 hypothetical protein DES53_101905 [Roseimicrobium gellanilyticum]
MPGVRLSHFTPAIFSRPFRWAWYLVAFGIAAGTSSQAQHEVLPTEVPSQQPQAAGSSGFLDTVLYYRPSARKMGGPGRMIGSRYDYQNEEAGSPEYADYTGEGDTANSSSTGGYFPTQTEAQYLPPNNPDYARSRGDRGYWAYSGIWPVRPASDNFYQRNGAFYERVERGLGLFVPDEELLAHSSEPNAWSVDLDYGLPFLTRDVAPDRAMIKLGPLFIDIWGISFSALYTQYSGDAPLDPDAPDEGWIGVVGMPLSASLRLTDSIYLQATGFLYFLPLEGEVGLNSGFGSGWGLGTNARLNFEWQWGAWNLRFYDYFGVVSSLADVNESWQVDEIDMVGRYRFGALDSASEANEFWDPRFGGYRNDVGFEAQRPMPNEWWFLGSVQHSDYWSEEDFDEHREYDQMSLAYRYMGDDWMFAPSFMYTLGSSDRFDNITHRAEARVNGRLTEYLSTFASLGYLWQTGDDDADFDSLLWEVGFVHDLTPYTRHSISAGQTYELSETLEEYVGDYARYTIAHQFSDRLSASAYAQWQDADNLTDDTKSTGWITGARASYKLGYDTNITAGVTYTLRESTIDDGPNPADEETWVYFAMLQKPLFSRIHGTATYQYIDQTGPIGSNLEEHLLILSLYLTF